MERGLSYYEGLAQVIVEAEKPDDLPSSSWSPRKASGGVPVQTEGLGTRGDKQSNPSQV